METRSRNIAEGLFVLPHGSYGDGYLIGSKCIHCNTVAFPKRKVCPHCLMDDSIREIPLSKKGTLFSYSVNTVAPEGFIAPYITGKIDLPENVRLFSVIRGCSPEEGSLRIGMDMDLVFEVLRKDGEGNDLVSYVFKPAAGLNDEVF